MTENIPANFEIFRGGWKETNFARNKIGNNPTYLKNNRGTFFTYGSNGKNIANREYGPVVSYKTTRPLQLLKITNKNTFNFFKFQAQNQGLKQVVNVLNKAYMFQNNGRIIRVSKEKYDYPIAQFMCTTGYDGYIANKLNTKYGGTFHQEIVLCKPTQTLKVNRVYGETRSSSSRGKPISHTFHNIPKNVNLSFLNL